MADDERYEEYDGEVVNYYKGKFNTAQFILDREWAVENAQMGKLPICLVAARVGKPSYDDDKDGDRFKQVTFLTEAVVPLPKGPFRDQVRNYMRSVMDDDEGGIAVDFPVSDEARRGLAMLEEHNQLEQYLLSEYSHEIRDWESPIETCMRLLEAQRIKDRDAGKVITTPRLAELDEDEGEPPASVAPDKVVDLMDALETSVAAAKAARSGGVQLPPMEEETFSTDRLKVGTFDPTDDEGFVVRHDPELGSDVERVGSVYSPSHTGADKALIDAVLD